jgi:hypothetical protein
MRARTLLVCLIGLLIILPANVLAVPRVSWDPGSIDQTLMVGESTTLSVSFMSSISLEDPELFTTPELQPFVITSELKSIRANKWYRVKLTLTAPSEMILGPYSGTIHLCDATKTLPDTLKINLSILRPMGIEGGILEFRNGVILDIPPGALTETTAIKITDIPVDQVDTILATSLYVSHKKRCLGGFTAEQDLVFNVPIKATVPVLPLDPGEIPVQVEVDLNEGKYWINKTNLFFLGNEGIAEIELQNFSTQTVVALNNMSSDELNKINEICKDPDLYWRPEHNDFCEAVDCLQKAYCQLKFDDRPPGWQATWKEDCCKEFGFTATMEATDFETKEGDVECNIAGDIMVIEYDECPYSPPDSDCPNPQRHRMFEQGSGCPEGVTPVIEVENPVYNLFVCEEEELKATVTLKNKDGGVESGPDPFWPQWISLKKEVADFIDPMGTIKGKSVGNTRVQAVFSESQPIPPGEAVVYVETKIPEFKVDPSQVPLVVGEQSKLEATGLDYNGNPLNVSDVTWSTDDPYFDIVEVVNIYVPGEEKDIKGIDKGSAIITATYDDGCETKEATAEITVGCSPITFTVDPPSASVEVGDGRILEAIIVDDQGIPIEPYNVTWSSDDVATAEVVKLDNKLATVEGRKPGGPVNITATFNDGCQVKTATAKITVFESPAIITVKVSPKDPTIYVGDSLPLTVNIYDKDSNYTGNCPNPMWTIPPSEAVSFNMDTQTVTGVDRGGPVTITATCEGVSGSTDVNVETPSNNNLMIIQPGTVTLDRYETRRVMFQVWVDGMFPPRPCLHPTEWIFPEGNIVSIGDINDWGPTVIGGHPGKVIIYGTCEGVTRSKEIYVNGWNIKWRTTSFGASSCTDGSMVMDRTQEATWRGWALVASDGEVLSGEHSGSGNRWAHKVSPYVVATWQWYFSMVNTSNFIGANWDIDQYYSDDGTAVISDPFYFGFEVVRTSWCTHGEHYCLPHPPTTKVENVRLMWVSDPLDEVFTIYPEMNWIGNWGYYAYPGDLTSVDTSGEAYELNVSFPYARFDWPYAGSCPSITTTWDIRITRPWVQ